MHIRYKGKRCIIETKIISYLIRGVEIHTDLITKKIYDIENYVEKID